MSRRYRGRRRHKARNYRGVLLILFVCILIGAGVVFYFGITSSKSSYRDKGIASLNEGKLEESIDWFKKALSEKQWLAEDIDTDIRYYLAQDYIYVGDYENAAKQYEKLSNSNGNYERTIESQSISKALVSYSKGEYEAALTDLLEAADNGYTELYAFVGSCYGMTGDYDNMKIYFDKYLENYEENTFIDSQFASAYINKGEYDKALEYVNKGLALEDETYRKQLRIDEIAYYELTSDYDKAFEKAKDYIDTYPDDEAGKREYDFLYTRVNEAK